MVCPRKHGSLRNHSLVLCPLHGIAIRLHQDLLWIFLDCGVYGLGGRDVDTRRLGCDCWHDRSVGVGPFSSLCWRIYAQ